MCSVSLGTQDSLAATLHTPLFLRVTLANPLLEVAED